MRAQRVSTIARRKPRTRSAAAADLVRLEYERDRLMRDLGMLEHRRAQTLKKLQDIEASAEKLREMLSIDPLQEFQAAEAKPVGSATSQTTRS
ncbi:MAG: hypothetical protein AAF909_12245 [Pseudomonadota bacterium]